MKLQLNTFDISKVKAKSFHWRQNKNFACNCASFHLHNFWRPSLKSLLCYLVSTYGISAQYLQYFKICPNHFADDKRKTLLATAPISNCTICTNLHYSNCYVIMYPHMKFQINAFNISKVMSNYFNHFLLVFIVFVRMHFFWVRPFLKKIFAKYNNILYPCVYLFLQIYLNI